MSRTADLPLEFDDDDGAIETPRSALDGADRLWADLNAVLAVPPEGSRRFAHVPRYRRGRS